MTHAEKAEPIAALPGTPQEEHHGQGRIEGLFEDSQGSWLQS